MIEIDARNLNLSQKELRSVGSVLNAAISHHLNGAPRGQIQGTFTLKESEDSDDFDISLDVSTNAVHNGVLSGMFS